MKNGDTTNSEVKFAFYLEGWSFEEGNKDYLLKKGKKVTTKEYTKDMAGSIFCPICRTNLTKTPKDKDLFSNGRSSVFAHIPKYKAVDCPWRTKRAEGKLYLREEDARQAIEDDELVIVHNFMQERPEAQEQEAGEYDQTPVEDINGPTANFPIGRHRGESFFLPTKIATVRGFCRRFDLNLSRYYVLPGSSYPVLLADALHDIKDVTGEDDKPKLYFGKIIKSKNAGKTPRNIRMTWFEHNDCVKDFCLKDHDYNQQEKGINNDAVGRIVLMWGIVTPSGLGLCIENLKWGEYALLPMEYNNLLE